MLEKPGGLLPGGYLMSTKNQARIAVKISVLLEVGIFVELENLIL